MPLRGEFPKGITSSEVHDKVRDQLMEKLLSYGWQLHGAWEDWRIQSTGASQSQIWGSERTYEGDMDFEWSLVYRGQLEAGKADSGLFGSRSPVKECVLPGGEIKGLTHVDKAGQYWRSFHVGIEVVPPEQEERAEMGLATRKAKNIRVIEYKCARCGTVFKVGRLWKHKMRHGKTEKGCGGELKLFKNELVKLG
jgi:hypothetical protein